MLLLIFVDGISGATGFFGGGDEITFRLTASEPVSGSRTDPNEPIRALFSLFVAGEDNINICGDDPIAGSTTDGGTNWDFVCTLVTSVDGVDTFGPQYEFTIPRDSFYSRSGNNRNPNRDDSGDPEDTTSDAPISFPSSIIVRIDTDIKAPGEIPADLIVQMIVELLTLII